MKMKTASLRTGRGGSCSNMVWMCADLKIWWLESNARPLSSLSMRSGRSCITVLSFMWRSELCQRGTRCSMCTHSVLLPSSMHFLHASCTLMVRKSGIPVTGSRMRMRRV